MGGGTVTGDHVLHHRPGFDPLVVPQPPDDTEVGFMSEKEVADARPVSDREVHVNPGVCGAEGADCARQDVGTEGDVTPDPDRAGTQLVRVLHRLLQLAEVGNDAARLRINNLSQGSEVGGAAPGEQRLANAANQGLDLVGDCRLGQVQGLGRAGEVAMVDNALEYSELLEGQLPLELR